jgi:hypothetical protein
MWTIEIKVSLLVRGVVAAVQLWSLEMSSVGMLLTLWPGDPYHVSSA